jgi:hypothetical protein
MLSNKSLKSKISKSILTTQLFILLVKGLIFSPAFGKIAIAILPNAGAQ